MKGFKETFISLLSVFILAVGLSGCTIIFQKGRRTDLEKIDELSGQLDELSAAKILLTERLKQEISDKQVKLDMAEKGLVITFVADVLFDSGKDKLRPESIPALDKVSRVLIENLSGFNIGIEGHTDDEPIKYSGWKSNWELSSARALSVLHYLADEKGVLEQRVSAIGYGQHRPVASNTDKESRALNRRVEIVVIPKVTKVKKQRQEPLEETSHLEPKVDLKKYK